MHTVEDSSDEMDEGSDRADELGGEAEPAKVEVSKKRAAEPDEPDTSDEDSSGPDESEDSDSSDDAHPRLIPRSEIYFSGDPEFVPCNYCHKMKREDIRHKRNARPKHNPEEKECALHLLRRRLNRLDPDATLQAPPRALQQSQRALT